MSNQTPGANKVEAATMSFLDPVPHPKNRSELLFRVIRVGQWLAMEKPLESLPAGFLGHGHTPLLEERPHLPPTTAQQLFAGEESARIEWTTSRP